MFCFTHVQSLTDRHTHLLKNAFEAKWCFNAWFPWHSFECAHDKLGLQRSLSVRLHPCKPLGRPPALSMRYIYAPSSPGTLYCACTATSTSDFLGNPVVSYTSPAHDPSSLSNTLFCADEEGFSRAEGCRPVPSNHPRNVTSFKRLNFCEGSPPVALAAASPASFWFLAPELEQLVAFITRLLPEDCEISSCCITLHAALSYSLPTPPLSIALPSLLSALWIRDALVWDADKTCILRVIFGGSEKGRAVVLPSISLEKSKWSLVSFPFFWGGILH